VKTCLFIIAEKTKWWCCYWFYYLTWCNYDSI